MVARRRGGIRACALGLAAVLIVGCAADEAAPVDGTPAIAASSGAAWEVRTDDPDADRAEFGVEESDATIHVTTGPAGITWSVDDEMLQGQFRAAATFVQHDVPVGYREAYGLFVGGRNLEGSGRSYTYFLVRATGEYLVKRRDGEDTFVLVDWTPSGAVRGAEVDGDEPRNVLAIDVGAEQVRFQVNGTVVDSLPRATVLPYGHAGLRVNHRLDLDVQDWTVGPTDDAASAGASPAVEAGASGSTAAGGSP